MDLIKIAHKCALALVLICVGSASFGAPASKDASTVSSGGPSQISLNGAWQFALGSSDEDKANLESFYREGFDLAKFRPIPVPSNWAMLGYESPQYKTFKGSASEGFYVRRFAVPSEWQDRRVLLHFEGVWSSAEVWLNGEPLGRQDTGFTRVSFEISSKLKSADNVLAVRVRQVQQDYLFDTNDDWTMGGIYQDVTLEAMPKLRWLDRVETQTLFDDQYRDADLKARIMVGDRHPRIPPGNFMNPGGDPYGLRITLYDAAGKRIEGQERNVTAHLGTGRETIVSLRVASPLHWTAETPNLYRLVVELLENGKVAHSSATNIGFRQISTSGGVLRINGQAVKLRGVNRHDEHPDTGRATTKAQWLEDIKLMKAANINYVRLAHYPPAQGFLDLCDELGMYVSDEISMGYGGNHMNNPLFAGAALLRSYATVARDINHPSIIIWSVGNEDPLTSLHLASIKAVKGIDPTRPVLMPWRAETWLPPEIDILSAHYFTAEKYDQLASRADRPILTTEFSHAFGNDGFGGLEERWQALTRHPSGAGGAIWMWADQGLAPIERKPDGSEARSLKVVEDGFDGITDSYRKPTRDYWEAKAVYAQVYPTIEKAQFVLGQPSIRVPIRNDFDFTDLNAVKIGWALMEDDKQLAKGTTSVSGPPHATSWLELPLSSLKSLTPNATYVLSLTFLRSDGSEIVRRAVELEPSNPSPMIVKRVNTPEVVERGAEITVHVGEVSYSFDRSLGQLSSASAGGIPQISGLSPTLWRPLNRTEMIIVKAEKTLEDLPDLNRYRASVSKWRLVSNDDKITIHAAVDYVVDQNNSFSVDYQYEIASSGDLTVRYAVSPKVQARWLPFVGMKLRTAENVERVRWLGLGPLDAYPNKRIAPTLGVWSEDIAGGADVSGMKATRWLELTQSSNNTGIRLRGENYVSYESSDRRQLLLLSSLLGLPTKGWRPEDASYRLDTDSGKPFVGELTIELSRGGLGAE